MSYETILQDLPEDFIRKMRNWARGNSGPANYAMTSAYDGYRDGSGYNTSPPPVIGGEVNDVDAAMMAVPNAYRWAVTLFWMYEGRSLSWLGRRLDVSYHTAEVRVRQGHHLLRAALAENRENANRFHNLATQAMVERMLPPTRMAAYHTVRMPEPVNGDVVDISPTSN